MHYFIGQAKKIVIPARAGTQRLFPQSHWIPAFAGTTNV